MTVEINSHAQTIYETLEGLRDEPGARTRGFSSGEPLVLEKATEWVLGIINLKD